MATRTKTNAFINAMIDCMFAMHEAKKSFKDPKIQIRFDVTISECFEAARIEIKKLED